MNKRVLVVEDSPVMREVTLAILNSMKVRCYSVMTGEEAVELADYFDLILMDIDLPGISGWEASRRIRRREKLKQAQPIPIVAITSNIEIEQAFLAGMNDYFRKPIARRELELILQKWLLNEEKPSTADKVYG